MLAANGKITMRQLQILIILSAMGTGVIVLPRRAAQFAGQDAWVIAVGLAVLAVFIGALISAAVMAATKTKPNAGFIEFTGFLLTRPVAYVLGTVLWIKLVVAAGLELRIFLEITQVIMLPQTPLPVVSIAVLLVCAYAAAKGMETRARVAEVLFAVMAIPFVFLIGLAFFDTNFSNLQPVLVTPPQDLLQGTLRLGFILTGMECLLLVSPFLKKGKHMGRHIVGALAFAGSIIILITVLTLAKFGTGVVNQPWPVLRMMDMLNIPGSFIERQEALIFSFWIITAFAIGNTMLFFGGLLVKDMFRPKPRHTGVIVTSFAVLAISVFPWGSQVYEILDFMYMTSGVFFLIILPLIILAAAKFKSSRLRTGLQKSAGVFLALLILFGATGCWDKVEIENRAFVVSIGIDAEDGEYAVSLSIPHLAKDEEDEESYIKTATGKTVAEALKSLDSKTNKTLYFGQAKLLVLSEELLENSDMLHHVVNALTSNSEIDLRINVLATDDSAKDILEAKCPDETMPGLFVSDIYRNKNKIGGISFALDLERLAASYADGAIIPLISESDGELKLGGATTINHCNIIGRNTSENSLTPDELKGFLWCKNHGNKGAVVTLSQEDNPISIEVKKHRTKIIFDSDSQNLRAIVNVKIKGEAEDPLPQHAIQELEKQIAKEITATANKLQNEFALDGYDWLETLRQKNYSLYKIHADNWHETFPQIEVIPNITVRL